MLHDRRRPALRDKWPGSFEILNMHTGAAVCFLLALFFYSFAWSETAMGLAVLGFLFEAVAWIIWLTADEETSHR